MSAGFVGRSFAVALVTSFVHIAKEKKKKNSMPGPGYPRLTRNHVYHAVRRSRRGAASPEVLARAASFMTRFPYSGRVVFGLPATHPLRRQKHRTEDAHLECNSRSALVTYTSSAASEELDKQ